MGAVSGELQGRIALVTGGDRGIGQAIALAMAGAGARVAIAARSRGQADKTARAIEDAGGVAWPFPADVTDLTSAPALMEKIGWRLGPVDILVTSHAAARAPGPAASPDLRELAAPLTLNVTAVLAMTAVALPGMLSRRWGRIVNIIGAGDTGPAPMAGGSACAVARAAIEACTIVLAEELAGTGVTVNAYRADASGAAGQHLNPSPALSCSPGCPVRRTEPCGTPAVACRRRNTILARATAKAIEQTFVGLPEREPPVARRVMPSGSRPGLMTVRVRLPASGTRACPPAADGAGRRCE